MQQPAASTSEVHACLPSLVRAHQLLWTELRVMDPNRSLVSVDLLRTRALTLVIANDRSIFDAYVPFVSNALLDRTAQVVWSLAPSELGGWSKQRMLALMIASISGGRLPSKDDAERPGQRMHEFLGRYRSRHKKMIDAEKALVRRAKQADRPLPKDHGEARLALEEDVYNCSYGCTPMSLPVRRVAPGMRPRCVEQKQTSVYEENMKLREANNRLRDLETTAVAVLQDQLRTTKDDLMNSVLTEHKSLSILANERIKLQNKLHESSENYLQLELEAKGIRKANNDLNHAVRVREKENDVLGAKVARAQMDLFQAMQLNDRKRQKLEQTIVAREVSNGVKDKEYNEMKEQVKCLSSECKVLSAKCLRLGGHIARLNNEIVTNKAKYERHVTRLEKKVEVLEAELEERKSVADNMRRLKNKMADKVRKAELRAATSGRRLERAQEAEQLLRELQVEYESLCDGMEEKAKEPKGTRVLSDALAARRNSSGRFEAEPASMRVLKWAQLSRNVPTSSVNANITEVLRVYAPEAIAPQPCERQMRKMRGEITIAGEAIAAFKVGKALRVISFGFDESTKFGISLLSTNIQIEPHTHPGTILDVVPRGATITAGCSATKIASLVERKIFRHSRNLLKKWRDCHDRKFGVGSWLADGGPSEENLGLHRLCENTLLMSDTCSAAEATKRLLADMAMEAAKDVVGSEAWQAMNEEEREVKYKVWLGDCHQHLRNIIINAMAKGATEHLQAELAADLNEFSSFDRMSVDGMDLIRAVFKELHASGEYAKGKGREFHKWCTINHPSFPLLPFERVAGSRQDLAFDGAVAIFWNRLVVIEFLHGLVHVPNADNKLEKFLATVLRCNEMTALLRVCTLFKFVFSEPMRWLAGKGSSLPGWSIVNANEVLDLAYQALLDIASDGHTLFDPSLEPFAKLAEKQVSFKQWCEEEHLARQIKSPDGQQHEVYRMALSEARNPTNGKGNAQAMEAAVALAEKMAHQGLIAMRDPRRAIKEKLTELDGDFAFDKCQHMHASTIGAHTTNDRVEKNFAIYDIACRLFRNAPVENLSGITQQKTTHDFEMAPIIAHDRRRSKNNASLVESPVPMDGYYWSVLSERQRESLVEMARHNTDEASRAGREAMKEQDLERLARREERVVQLLHKVVDDYAYAKELYVHWTHQRATRAEEICDAIKDKPEARQLEYLRLQIEMRVLGLGWTEFATHWSSNKDDNIGTVAHLRDLLIGTILPYEHQQEREKVLPTEAQPPLSVPSMLRKLGTLDLDALEIEKKSIFGKEELEKKVQDAMERRVRLNIADDVEKLQPKEPPLFNQELVGKRLEVCWKYFDQDTGEPILIWTSGTVKRVADGLSDRRSPRARAILPGGAILWAWDADREYNEQEGEQWLILLPSKWNPSKACVYGWRYDPCELH